jgi:hypothetical protein
MFYSEKKIKIKITTGLEPVLVSPSNFKSIPLSILASHHI